MDYCAKSERKCSSATLTDNPSLISSEEVKDLRLPSSPIHADAVPQFNLASMNYAVCGDGTPLPQYKVHVPFQLTCNRVLDLFLKVSKSRGFQIIEQTNLLATAIHKEKLSLRQLLTCCVTPASRPVSAVRLHIGVNEKRCKRTVLVKGIYGSHETVMGFLQAFQAAVTEVSSSTHSRNSSIRTVAELKYEPLTPERTLEDEDFSWTIKNESACYYQFHKILSSEAYSLGKRLATFIERFHLDYSDPECCKDTLPVPVQPTQMERVKSQIEDTVAALFAHFNFGKTAAEKMMQYCRPAVEKFVFSRLHSTLFALYEAKHREIDERFAKRQKALAEVEPGVVFDVLEVREK